LTKWNCQHLQPETCKACSSPVKAQWGGAARFTHAHQHHPGQQGIVSERLKTQTNTCTLCYCCRGHVGALPPTGSSSGSSTAPQLPAADWLGAVHDQPRVGAALAAGTGAAVRTVLGCSQRLLHFQVGWDCSRGAVCGTVTECLMQACRAAA
jgi:hypothetical protein